MSRHHHPAGSKLHLLPRKEQLMDDRYTPMLDALVDAQTGLGQMRRQLTQLSPLSPLSIGAGEGLVAAQQIMHQVEGLVRQLSKEGS